MTTTIQRAIQNVATMSCKLVVIAPRLNVGGATDALAALAADDAPDRPIDVHHVVGTASFQAAPAPDDRGRAGLESRLYVMNGLHTSQCRACHHRQHQCPRGFSCEPILRLAP